VIDIDDEDLNALDLDEASDVKLPKNDCVTDSL